MYTKEQNAVSAGGVKPLCLVIEAVVFCRYRGVPHLQDVENEKDVPVAKNVRNTYRKKSVRLEARAVGKASVRPIQGTCTTREQICSVLFTEQLTEWNQLR